MLCCTRTGALHCAACPNSHHAALILSIPSTSSCLPALACSTIFYANHGMQEEARLEKKNPVDAFLDQLIAGESENGEAFWKDGFSGVGAGPEVHKLLRTNGQVSFQASGVRISSP